MDREELRKSVLSLHFPGMKRGGAMIAAAMTAQERSLRAKKAAQTRWAGHIPKVPHRGKRRAYRAALDIAERAASAEPEITKAIQNVVSANGGRMESLAHRLKTVDSLTRKIATKAKERGQSIEESASQISDALRYTAVIDDPPPGSYSRAIEGMLKSLKDDGLEVLELETHWRRGDAYNGVHLIARHPNGSKVELQFHTPASLAAKGETHKIYEIARADGISPEIRAIMVRRMVQIADVAPIPAGALRFGVRVFRPPEKVGK